MGYMDEKNSNTEKCKELERFYKKKHPKKMIKILEETVDTRKHSNDQ